MWVVAQNSSGFRLCRLLGIAAGGGGGAIARRGLLLLLPLLLLLALLALPLLLLPPLPLLLACPLPLLLPLPMPMPPLPVVAATALAISFRRSPYLLAMVAQRAAACARCYRSSLLLLACDGIASSFDADAPLLSGGNYALPLWLPADRALGADAGSRDARLDANGWGRCVHPSAHADRHVVVARWPLWDHRQIRMDRSGDGTEAGAMITAWIFCSWVELGSLHWRSWSLLRRRNGI